MSSLTSSTSEGDVEAITRLADNSVAPSLSQDSTQQQQQQQQQSQEQSVVSLQSTQPKKFTSLNVNKRFLEKASPIPSPALPVSLKLGESNSPRLSSSPSNSTRLTSAKLSSVPKAQPVGWATAKPSTPAAAPSIASHASSPTATAVAPSLATDLLPSDASSAKPASSPRLAHQSLQQATPAGSAASPRLVGMGRQSPRPTSAGIDFGPLSGRASPGLLGNRAVSPASASRAPWASLKSGLSASGTRPSTMSDFPTAAEAAKAKQDQEERAAAAAAKEAARQQAALQALDRFRGGSLGTGKHWDEMEDEDGGFLDEVVEFGDGTQYKIPATNDDHKATNPDAPPISKEERFKDVSHDRSWPPRGPQLSTAPRAPPPSAAAQARGPLSADSASTPSRRFEQRADKVIIPTTGASVSLRSPVETREPAAHGHGRDRRGPPTLGSGSRSDASAAPAASQHSTQAVRAWGPLAQRQASLNPGSVPAPAAVQKPAVVSPPPSVPASAAKVAESIASVPSPSNVPAAVAVVSSSKNLSQSSALSPSANQVGAAAIPPPPPSQMAPSSESRALPYANRPLPPHLAQNGRPASESSNATVGRRTVFSDAEGRKPANAAPQPSQPSPWGPRGLAQARLEAEGAQASPPAPVQPQPAPAPAAEEEDISSSIERARKRRQEEENVRLAEKERARQKALAIEEKIKAAEAAREAEARKVAAAKAQAEADKKKEVEATVASPAVPQLLRKQGPADEATTWRTARSPSTSVSNAGPNPGKERAEQRSSRREQDSHEKAAAAAPSQPRPPVASPTKDEKSASPLTEQDIVGATWRKEQNRIAEPASAQRAQSDVLTAASPEGQAAASDAPKIILSRPAPTSQSQGPAVSDSVDQKVARRAPESTPDKTKRVSTAPSDRKKARDSPSEQQSVKEPKIGPSLAPAPVKLYPVVAQEPVQTRREPTQDPAPAWNRFVVHLASAYPHQRLNRFQQKQLAAKAAAMNAPGRLVSVVTWELPVTASSKTQARDDLLFPKPYNRGVLVASVSLPTRTLPRGLPCIVPPPDVLGPRKQARFDLTPDHKKLASSALNAEGEQAVSERQVSSPTIQVKLPGRNAAIVQPTPAGLGRSTHLHSGLSLGDASTDAIISEVLSTSSPAKGAYDDRHLLRDPVQAPLSMGPLDHPHNAFAPESYGYASNGTSQPQPQQQQQRPNEYRKGRRGSNTGAAFFEERSGNTPSPVSFMVNSEIRGDMSGARGNLSPFGITPSARGSQAQTPANGSSVLPSPSLSTRGTWGQSSLTFPVMEPRSSNLADRDHIKSVWSLAADSHARETQNSLKDIADDFLPSTMPMSVHDFRADDPLLTRREVGHSSASTVNLRQTSPASHFSRFSQFGRTARDPSVTAQELSPVAHRSSGFEPSARSPSSSREATAHLQAAAAAASQQREANFSTNLNGAASKASAASQGYGSNFPTSYPSRSQQHTDGSNIGHNGIGGYGGFGGSNNGGGLTTDFNNSGYGTGSMTPTSRQGYGQYNSQASTARSAPGSPYSGEVGRQGSNLTGPNAASTYSLFANGGTGNGGSSNRSPHGDGGAGLGVMDESAAAAAFGGPGRQFYSGHSSMSYPSGQGYNAAQQQQRQTGQSGSTGKWPSESTPNPPASTLRPAANVFSPQRFSPSQRSAAKNAAPASARGNSSGPIDGDPVTSATSTNASAAFSTSTSGYNRFSPSSGLW